MSLLSILLCGIIVFLLCFVLLRLSIFLRSPPSPSAKSPLILAFYHPYCDAGGGGERVLWKYVEFLDKHAQETKNHIKIVIFTGDHVPPQDIIARARSRFNLPPFSSGITVHFVRVSLRCLLEARFYPRFTMLGQSLGAIVLAIECMIRHPMHIMVDTTGWGMMYPIIYMLGVSNIHAYIHYPTISSDMLQLVHARRETYNNKASISSSALGSRVKLLYYTLFASLYKRALSYSRLSFANSTWTYNHVHSLLNDTQHDNKATASPNNNDNIHHLHIVYPPVDTSAFSCTNDTQRNNWIVSIGQFRPEKDHALQIKSFHSFVQKRESLYEKISQQIPKSSLRPLAEVRLLLIGGCRNAGDEQLVSELRSLVAELKIQHLVDFHINVPFHQLVQFTQNASVGIHTMWNEHFGIGIVEYMAAGLITVAHNSGGPRADIIRVDNKSPCGFLAASLQEYTTILMSIFDSPWNNSQEMKHMRHEAQERAKEFSDEKFEQKLQQYLVPFIQDCMSGPSQRKQQ